MEISQVLNTLQLEKFPPADILEELVTDEIFLLRDYFLRNPVVKPLFVSRIRKLKNLQLILTFFCQKPETKLNQTPSDYEFSDISMVNLIQSFEKKQAEIKNKLASSLQVPIVVFWVEEYMSLQNKFEQKFKTIFSQTYQMVKESETVKLADQLNTGVVIKLLVSDQPHEALPLLQKEYARILLIP